VLPNRKRASSAQVVDADGRARELLEVRPRGRVEVPRLQVDRPRRHDGGLGEGWSGRGASVTGVGRCTCALHLL
jgi:hypothetical protein